MKSNNTYFFKVYYIQLTLLFIIFPITIYLSRFIPLSGLHKFIFSFGLIIVFTIIFFASIKKNNLTNTKQIIRYKLKFRYIGFTFILGFIIYYSFYFFHYTYLPNGYDGPKYLYFSKILITEGINKLTELQKIIRIMNVLSFSLFQQISPFAISQDMKIYISGLFSFLCLLFSYIVFKIKKTSFSFVISYVIILSSYNLVRLAAGLYDNLFVMILFSFGILSITRIIDSKKIIDMCILTLIIILIGITHFNVFGIFDILVFCIVISESLIILKENKDILKTINEKSIQLLSIGLLMANIIVFILQHKHLFSFLEISQISTDSMPSYLMNQSLFESMAKNDHIYLVISIVFFLYSLNKLSNLEYRIVSYWYVLSIFLIFGTYIGINFPVERILIISPIPIMAALGINEMISKLKNIGNSKVLLKLGIFLFIAILVNASLINIYESKRLVNDGKLIIKGIDPTLIYLEKNNINESTFLYSKIENINLEKFPDSITPTIFYILEEFYTDSHSINLIFFGSLTEYISWKTDFYDTIREYHKEEYLVKKIWYSQIMKYDIGNKSNFIIIHKDYANKEYIIYKDSNIPIYISDELLIIDIRKLKGDGID